MLTPKQQHMQFQEYLKKHKEEVSENLKKKILPTTEYEDYNFLEIIGHGSYGKVVAAKNIMSDEVFAVKVLEKKFLVKEERLLHLLSEIRILNAVRFEFLIYLECYFTNECFVFLVLPFIRGEHFLNTLRTFKKFEERTAMFFAGQIVLAFEYLHYNGIVYRDLKPENLLLDLQGYLKLVDYGFAKHIGHSFSYSFCGTPEYLAPEVLSSKGYSFSPDWWTLGILLFEMCYGMPPFTATNELRLYEKIVKGNVIWPESFSKDLKSLLQGLLQTDRTKRLGCKKQRAADVKFHKWFSSLDWAALWKKTLLSPITPKERNFTGNKPVFSNRSCYIPSRMIGNIDVSV